MPTASITDEHLKTIYGGEDWLDEARFSAQLGGSPAWPAAPRWFCAARFHPVIVAFR